TFVTRKITRGIARIKEGLDTVLKLGNMDSLRDWGHAKDYVEMQWLMLQQDHAEDFVIATGKQISVREFVKLTCKHAGIDIRFEGTGVDEKGIDVVTGKVIVSVDPRYFRPTEVETLLGSPEKAKAKLGWVPKITVEEMAKEMVENDLLEARREKAIRSV
ncbi:MAG TPA: GDP-mannose 4,6-dehydratase, partial [Fibrobacteria bacterium]|nr:GDP-mannose 4,6-dehydratase [Fibrobacteria bacterium]